MDAITPLLTLPMDTLVMLVGGYLGYVLAYTGRRGSHTPMDVLFRTLTFGLVVRLATHLTSGTLETAARSIIGILGALVVASIWRIWLGEFAFQSARKIGLLDHDGYRSVWESVVGRGKNYKSVIVHLKNGTILMSCDLPEWSSLPFGPVLLGEDGSVGLYVTDICTAENTDWRPMGNAKAGVLTVVSAAEVSRVQVQWT